jgi:hypothetical protein
MKRDFGSKFMAQVIQGPAKEAHQKILFFRCEVNGVRGMRVGHLLWYFFSAVSKRTSEKVERSENSYLRGADEDRQFKSMLAGDTLRVTGQLSLLTSQRSPSAADRGAVPASPAGRGFLPHHCRSMAE